jgi:putative ABC transport system substrate-binding protein
MRRAAILRDPTTPSGIGQFGIIQAVASSIGLEVFPVHIRDAAAIESALATLARLQDGGVIVSSSGRATFHQVINLVAEHKLPAIYWDRALVAAGGLVSYGPNFLDQHRRAAGYVDRILKGEKPGDLPVQAPTKYELVINLKTANALGLEVPSSLLARADEVIE